MLLRNMNPKYGHCNGTRYIVTAIHGTRLIEAKIIGGDHAGNSILSPRIPIQPSKAPVPCATVFLHDGEQKSGAKFQTCGRISTEAAVYPLTVVRGCLPHWGSEGNPVCHKSRRYKQLIAKAERKRPKSKRENSGMYLYN